MLVLLQLGAFNAPARAAEETEVSQDAQTVIKALYHQAAQTHDSTP